MTRYEDPDWPSSATSEGQSLRFYAALSSPGNPRRAKLMLLGLLWLVLMFVALVLVLSLTS